MVSFEDLELTLERLESCWDVVFGMVGTVPWSWNMTWGIVWDVVNLGSIARTLSTPLPRVRRIFDDEMYEFWIIVNRSEWMKRDQVLKHSRYHLRNLHLWAEFAPYPS